VKMGKLPLGQGTKHIKSSNGPDTSHLSHYTTTYAAQHSKEGFTPRPATHAGTGYLANFRPGVYYAESLDHVDNPEILTSIRSNYISTTKDHFKESKGARGTERLPPSIYHQGSGFNTGTVNTLPLHREVTDVHIDTRSTTDRSPNRRPLLFNLQRRDPVEEENSGSGPGYMKPETASRFTGQSSIRMNLEGKTVAKKENSGFTHAINIEPITYRPDEDFHAAHSDLSRSRTTGISNMKASFNSNPFLKGTEKASPLSKSLNETGFVKGTMARPVFYSKPNSEYYTKDVDVPNLVLKKLIKSDPAELANMTNPHNRSSITQIHFKPAQSRPPFEQGEGQKMGRCFIGKKEPSGYCENNDRWIVPKANSPDHFTSYYKYKHHDMNPTGLKREGYLRGSVMNQVNNGFTKSTAVHAYGKPVNNSALLRSMNTYQAKSLLSRDNLFDDHTHDAKLRVTA